MPPKLADKIHEYNNFLFSVTRGFDVSSMAAALPPNVAHAVDWRQAGRTLHALLDRLEERQATLLG